MAQAEDDSILLKLLLVGDAGVGKSSILLRFTDDSFDEHLQSTIGIDFKQKRYESNGKKVRATIWDTAGQERFRTLTGSYYRGSQGVILVYDITRAETFENLSRWLEEVEMYCPDGGKGVAKVLVGNKSDLEAEREVSTEEGEVWARSKGMMFLECSAKTRAGIDQVFDELISKILETPSVMSSRPTRGGATSIPNVAGDREGGNGGRGGLTGCCQG